MAMTTLNLKKRLQKRIDYLDSTQLERLHDIFEKEFPESTRQNKGRRRKLGTMPGLIKYMAPDFDEPLEDFKDYMPE